ncbi:MAG TPA: hypothetical protein VER14_04535 [Phototrophicaceae bacterium]|nr:hypothetical protein [Phototrophicaceae bacterium]
MFNKKQSTKTSLSNVKNTFLVTAIAFVLVMGTGYSSMQSFGLDYNGIGDLSAFNGFTQSAECAGLGNDCAEDNSVTNPPAPTPEPEPSACELCLAELSDEQEAALLAALNVGTLAEACLLADIDAVQLLADLTEEGLSIELITEIFACLDLEVPVTAPV